MKQIMLFWVLMLSFQPAHAQKRNRIDSLKAVCNSMPSDTAKVKVLNRLADGYQKSNLDSSLFYSNAAFNLAKQLNFTNGMLNSYGNLGRSIINSGNYQEAIKFCKEGLNYTDAVLAKSKNTAEIRQIQDYKTTILRNMGIAFDFMAIYPEALKYYTECLKLQERIGDLKSTAGVYHNIGGVYLDYEKLDDALNYFQKAYNINKEIGNKRWLTNNLTNMAIVYSKQKHIDRALTTYKEALHLFESMKDDAGKTKVLSNIGAMYAEINQVDSSIFYCENALRASKELGDPRTTENVYVTLGKNYTTKKNYPKARTMFREAGKIVTELEDFGLLEDYYKAMYDLDFAQGNLASAIRNLQLSHAYRDSIHNEDNVRKLTQTQLNYEFEKKEKEAQAEQDKKDALAAKELQRQKLMRNWFIGGFIVVLIFATVFFRQRVRIKKEKARSEELLLNILPAEVAEELKEKGSAEAKLINEVSVLFTDFKGFTELSEKMTPKALVSEINECFSVFDNIMQRHGVEKIKTIGDAYMAAGGLPTPNSTHAVDVVKAALEIQDFMQQHRAAREAEGKLFFEIRIGIHTGPVVAGIVGIKKFAYDIWGDTVNTASRMESSGVVGKVNISETTYELVKAIFNCKHRGKITAKGKGEIDMYFVDTAV